MKNKINPKLFFFTYLKHISNKPKGYTCELKECPELCKEVEKLTKES